MAVVISWRQRQSASCAMGRPFWRLGLLGRPAPRRFGALPCFARSSVARAIFGLWIGHEVKSVTMSEFRASSFLSLDR
jgi:hypothetical protein